MKLIDIENSRITQLYFGFTINLDFKAEDFIRKNLLMYAYKGYNHNKSSTSKKNLKIFDYEEFEIMFSADKVQDDFKQNNLKVELRIKESSALKKLGVKTILDLKYKEVLKKLFNIFLNKYDNLVIINSVINPEQFIIKDKIKMPLYMNPDYWVELPKEKNRQAKYRARKDFERIQRDYSLNTLKKELRESLISAFNNFINK
jgi:hypothetical protein